MLYVCLFFTFDNRFKRLRKPCSIHKKLSYLELNSLKESIKVFYNENTLKAIKFDYKNGKNLIF